MDRSDKRFHFVRVINGPASNSKKGKKHRNRIVYAKYPVEAGTDFAVNFDRETGAVDFVGAVPGSVSSTLEYDRESGKPKHQFWGGSNSTVGYFDERRYIESSFDYVCAVDTNKKEFDGVVYAVASTYRLNGCVADYKGLKQIQGSRVGSQVFVNPKAPNSETIGWHHFMSVQLSTLGMRSDSRIGLVVDSELGGLQDMNLRRKPYHRDFFLPANIQLIYASDQATNTMSGMLLRACHKTARDILNSIESGERPTDTNGCEDYDASIQVVVGSKVE